ncbi:hypothetical protein LLG46_04665 [bacterium]|nr:hypothetical protein [bacterium]
MNTQTLDWLLGEDNPGVRARTLTGLCDLPNDDKQVIEARKLVLETLDQARDLSWMENPRPTAPIRGLIALSESGLTRDYLDVDSVIDRFQSPYDINCGDFQILRSLVMLGYGNDSRVQTWLAQVADAQLPDGGWLCLHRVNKMNRIPKSCIKANMHALLMASEMKKCGMHFLCVDGLIEYFLRRRLFYRMDNPQKLVLDVRPGYRMIDAYFPIEIQRVGLPHLLEALASLGVGQAPELQEAWDMLKAKQDEFGRVKLEGTLAKSYLPKERVGRPGKWVTLYTCLAQKALGNKSASREGIDA